MVSVVTKDQSMRRAAETGCGLDKRVEHGPQVECRAADDLEHIGGGCLLLQGFAQLVEQAGVLHCDPGLPGEVFDGRVLFVVERASLLTKDADDSMSSFSLSIGTT